MCNKGQREISSVEEERERSREGRGRNLGMLGVAWVDVGRAEAGQGREEKMVILRGCQRDCRHGLGLGLGLVRERELYIEREKIR